MTLIALDAHPIDKFDTTDLQAEVRAVNEANGWFEADRSLLEGIALLHTEAAEATDAYRRWKLEDMTYPLCGGPHGHAQTEAHLCKPEGVGSELADVLIRLLDETDRQNLGLVRSRIAGLTPRGGRPGPESFADCIAVLHEDIARAGQYPNEATFAKVFGRLVAIADEFGFDLMFEYERKIAFNRTRGFRHGGRHL